MTTVKEIITNIKTVLKEHLRIMKSEIKMLRDDVFLIHLPIPDKAKSFPYHVGMNGHNLFVPLSFGPDGIDLKIELPSFEEEYGFVSDHAAASLAIEGLVAAHEDELSEVRVRVFRNYITDDYIRSHIRLYITPKSDMEFEIDPWFHFLYQKEKSNTIVVSIDADVVFDVYRELMEEEKQTSAQDMNTDYEP